MENPANPLPPESAAPNPAPAIDTAPAAPAPDYSVEYANTASPEERAAMEALSAKPADNTPAPLQAAPAAPGTPPAPAALSSEPFPATIAEMGFQSPEEARNFIIQTNNHNQQLQTQIKELTAQAQRMDAYIRQQQAAPAAQQQQAPAPRQLPKTWSEAIGADWNAEAAANPFQAMQKLVRAALEHDDKFGEIVGQRVKPLLQPFEKFTNEYQQNYQKFTTQEQQAQFNQQAQAITQDFVDRNPDFAPGKPLNAPMATWVSQNRAIVDTLMQAGRNPFDLAAAHIRAQAQTNLAQAQTRSAEAKVRQTGGLASTARPGNALPTIPQGNNPQEETTRRILELGGSHDTADAANQAFANFGL